MYRTYLAVSRGLLAKYVPYLCKYVVCTLRGTSLRTWNLLSQTKPRKQASVT